MMSLFKVGHWLFLFSLLISCKVSHGGEVGITYLKTIGQVWPELPMLTGGGRLSLDEKGYLYAGTPGQHSYLQKISPEGRIVWRDDNVHSSHYGTAVDDKYVYSGGNGYYGYGHLQRRKKMSGVVPPGWDFVWTKPTDIVKGVRGFVYPGPLLVDGSYLYVLDIGNGELRRLNKETGVEKPFATAVKVEGALDMDFSKGGSILVLANAKEEKPAVEGAPQLTPAFVVEINKETGKVIHARKIGGLRRSAAMAVHPRTGAICIGEGGTLSEPVNKVRIFSAEGADTGVAIGRGGEWQGPWSPNAFAFSAGLADIAFDPEGGLWSNCFSHRMAGLGLLVHFTPAYKPDKTFLAALADGIAVNNKLEAILGGNYKLSWTGDLLWTSGLLNTGKPNQFPTTVPGWTIRAVYADAERDIFVNIHGPAIFSVNPATGEATGKSLALPVPMVNATTYVGTNIYILGGGKVYRTTAELAAVEEYFTIPEDVAKKAPNGLAVSQDQKTVFVSAGSGADARVYAYNGGNLLWQARAGALLARHKGILLATDPAGPGILALSAADGGLSGLFGKGAIDDRPALTGITGAAVGNKDGADYLFLAGQSRVLVYRITAAD